MANRSEVVKLTMLAHEYEQLEWMAGLHHQPPATYARAVLARHLAGELERDENNGKAFAAWKARRRDPLTENL